MIPLIPTLSSLNLTSKKTIQTERMTFMSNIIDYLQWRGDIQMGHAPFNDVDNLILAEFSYLRLEMADQPCEGLRISDIAPIIKSHMEAFGYIDEENNNNRLMLELMASGKRFGDVLVREYQFQTDETSEKQFAAMTFFLPDETVYVAFRGTDSTLVGWKEDFKMAFTCPVPAQAEALNYLEMICKATPLPVRVGGHSKGGNLAVYAAANLSDKLKNRILQVYSNDGPGMNDATINSDGYKTIEGKIISILPEFSIIGMLLHQHKDYKVVSSTSKGLMQHSPFTWEVRGAGFIELPNLKRSSLQIDAILDQWLFEMPEDERMQLVEALFFAMKHAEIKTVEGLITHPVKIGISLLSAIRHFDGDTRHLVWEKLTRLAGVALKEKRADHDEPAEQEQHRALSGN